ncbi:MAG: TrkH family potassium uptake protein [Thermoplasmata archaeon]|nr:MAG: TrkH family potassium uptake protein [Thermoplasmata archaeon]
MKDLKIVLRDTGAVLLAVGVITVIAAVVPLIKNFENIGEEIENVKWIFLTMLVFLAAGALFRLIGRGEGEVKIKHAMLIAAFSWLLISLISTIPFHYINYSEKMDFLSAFFEAVAGWTGTGLTMVNFESALPPTIQFWRTFTQWIGGVGVIVLTLIVLARPGTGSFTLYRSEAREEKIHPSIISTVKSIWWILLLYTFLGIVILFIAGMPLWEAVNHAMTGITTGGFSVTDDSIASYSPLIQALLIPLMVAGAIAFAAHYDLLTGKIKNFFKDAQTQALLALLFLGIFLLTFLNMDYYSTFLQSFKYSAFQFASALTCTGFATADIPSWGASAKMLLSFAMVIGGAAGSTAGGIKLFRIILLTKGTGWKIRHIFLPPKGTIRYKLGGKSLARDEALEEITEASILSFLWMILLFIGIMVILYTTHASLDNAIFEVCSAQGNVGLSTGITSAAMNPIAKFMLIINMWIGRLEIIPILVFFRALVKGQSIV